MASIGWRLGIASAAAWMALAGAAWAGSDAGGVGEPVAAAKGAVAEAKDAPTEVEKERFAQSAYGPKLSALAIAAEKSAWADWSRKWAGRKDGKVAPLAEARVVGGGAKIEMAVVLTTSGEPFQSQEPLDYVVSIYRPDGSLERTMPPSGCMPKGATIKSGYMGLCDVALDFELEPDDPRGLWVFKVRMEVPGQGPLVFGTSFESY